MVWPNHQLMEVDVQAITEDQLKAITISELAGVKE